MTDFTSVRHRVKYCEREIKNLIATQNDSLSGPWSIRSTTSEDSKILEQTLTIDDDYVYRQSMKLSAIVHHLRSTLDNIVYLIATSKATLGDKERRNLYFPIIEDIGKWANNPTRNLFKNRCENKYYQLLLHMQPFASNLAWDGCAANPLMLLHTYSNEDKHRQIKVTYLKVNNLDFEVSFRFRKESETCIPRGTIFPKAFRTGGLIQRFELDNSFESFVSNSTIESELWVEGIDMPAKKFLSDCLLVVQAIAENFERIGEVADWNSSFNEY